MSIFTTLLIYIATVGTALFMYYIGPIFSVLFFLLLLFCEIQFSRFIPEYTLKRFCFLYPNTYQIYQIKGKEFQKYFHKTYQDIPVYRHSALYIFILGIFLISLLLQEVYRLPDQYFFIILHIGLTIIFIITKIKEHFLLISPSVEIYHKMIHKLKVGIIVTTIGFSLIYTVIKTVPMLIPEDNSKQIQTVELHAIPNSENDYFPDQ